MSNELALISVSDIKAMAKIAVESGLFGVANENQATALMLLCQAKSLHPMLAVERYHIIEGRPSMKAEMMLAEFLRLGGSVEWHRRDDKCASATFTHPAGGKVPVEWTWEQAQKITTFSRKTNKWTPITEKNTWKSYPRQMLHARCVSEGVRATCPEAVLGTYTPEEIQDFSDDIKVNHFIPPAPAAKAREMSKVAEPYRKPEQPAPVAPPPPQDPREQEATDAEEMPLMATAAQRASIRAECNTRSLDLGKILAKKGIAGVEDLTHEAAVTLISNLTDGKLNRPAYQKDAPVQTGGEDAPAGPKMSSTKQQGMIHGKSKELGLDSYKILKSFGYESTKELTAREAFKIIEGLVSGEYNVTEFKLSAAVPPVKPLSDDLDVGDDTVFSNERTDEENAIDIEDDPF